MGHIRCLSSDAAYTTIRGQNCLAWKHKALNACLETHLAVVLLATIVKGVNDTELGALVRFAAEKDPLVRGLHLQPVAFFGRITLPELTEDIALSDFHPHPIRPAASPKGTPHCSRLHQAPLEGHRPNIASTKRL